MMNKSEPLAYRMRPKHIDDVVGQQHIIGPSTPVYKMIKNGYVPSLLLYGEPGIGKTSIASAIAGTVNRPFFILNGVEDGKKEILEIVNQARKLKDEGTEGAVLFVDEIHRWTKTQADVLLPHLEAGLLILISATTSNPFHDVIPALRSRSGKIVELNRLEPEDITIMLRRSLQDTENGLGNYVTEISDESLHYIASSTNGEVRSALNNLEMAFMATEEDGSGKRHITHETVVETCDGSGFNHDKDGDLHYNILSAMQKSIRGSDTDAALHYASHLVKSGDMKSLLRRLVVIAAEEIGVVDVNMSIFAESVAQSCERVGFPEATGLLSNLIVALCNSPKSKASWLALGNAMADIENGDIGEIPMHLRDTHYKTAGLLGNGVGYLYPHDYPNESFGSWVNQQYMPDKIKDREYYRPHEDPKLHVGKEKYYADVYKRLKKAQKQKKT